jgi:hypothetical protein
VTFNLFDLTFSGALNGVPSAEHLSLEPMDESASFDALVIGVNTVDGAAANAVLPRLTTRRATAKSSDGNRASKSTVSGQAARFPSTMALKLIERFVTHYNTVRLHSAIGYVTPADWLAGRHLDIFTERDRKIELARQTEKINDNP